MQLIGFVIPADYALSERFVVGQDCGDGIAVHPEHDEAQSEG
jgi:hypothetical protein